jgi:DNA replication and repair protein RecF
VHLAELRLRDFRNYARLDVAFEPGFHLLVGDNGQGKTNLLEAIYLLATLRSFRGVGNAQLVRWGQEGWFVGARVVSQTTRDIQIYWSPTQRRVALDNQPVGAVTDYLGVVRAVVFCAEDLQLIKGPARARRRFMDLLLSQSVPGYLECLQRYTQAVRARNALLKQPDPDLTALEAFTSELIRWGEPIIRRRHELVPRLEAVAQQAYSRLAPQAEQIRLEYRPSVRADFAIELAQARVRERQAGTTLLGPHRDELLLLLDQRAADQFASEGQKRTLAIALKLAQADYLTAVHGTAPILLLDDVLGELDAHRRANLLPLLDRMPTAPGQVFMTCTEATWPRELSRPLHRWHIKAGSIQPG